MMYLDVKYLPYRLGQLSQRVKVRRDTLTRYVGWAKGRLLSHWVVLGPDDEVLIDFPWKWQAWGYMERMWDERIAPGTLGVRYPLLRRARGVEAWGSWPEASQ